MKRKVMMTGCVSVCAVLIAAAGWSLAGPLAPPSGPVASTYKTLTEIEPRVLVSAANTPGSANAMFVLSQPGSYYLGGNVIAIGGKNAIVIAADNVTLDLNGFTIDGSTNSVGFPSGVNTLFSPRRGLVVRNGNINGFSGYGVTGGVQDAHFEHLGLDGNKSGSIEVFGADNSIASHIRVSAATGEVGIQLGSNSIVEHCAVSGTSAGINVGFGSVVSHCVLTNQIGVGIAIGGGLVENCAVEGLGGGSSFSDGGIKLGGGRTTVRSCTIRDVASAGIFLGADCAIENCMISQCAKGVASSSFSSGRARIEHNDIVECSGVGIDLPAGKHFVIGNRLRGNGVNINANASVVLGEVVNCGPGTPPAAASNPTANLIW